jgi:hypothetical protein
MDATPTGGRLYNFFSTGSASFLVGAFGVYDTNAAQYRFHITSTGNVGIGNVTTFGDGAGSTLSVRGKCAIGNVYWTSTAIPANSLAVEGVLGVGIHNGTAKMHIRNASAANQVAILQAAAAQTADFLQLINSAGTVQTCFTKDGYLSIGASSIPATSRDTKFYVYGNGTTPTGRTNFLIENASADSAASFMLKNASGNFLSVQCTGSTYAGGSLGNIASFNANGLNMFFGTDGLIASGGTSNIYFGAGGYDASNNFVVFHSDKKMGVNNLTPSATLDITAKNGSTVGFAVKAAASQTANLFEVKEVGGSAITYIRKSGAFKPVSLADAGAENDSIYFSTNSNTLTYKTSGASLRRLNTYGTPKTNNYYLPTNISQDPYTKDITVTWTLFAFDNGFLLN